jgi:hypothetical protein
MLFGRTVDQYSRAICEGLAELYEDGALACPSTAHCDMKIIRIREILELGGFDECLGKKFIAFGSRSPKNIADLLA